MYKVKDNLFFDMHLAQANYSANEIKGAAFWLFCTCTKMSNGENPTILYGDFFKNMVHPNGYKIIWML